MSRILRLWATTGLIAATVLTALVFAVAGSAGQQQSGPLVIGGEQIASAQLYELAKREGELVAYMSYPNAIMREVTKQFTTDTGIKLSLTSLPSDQLSERVLTEWGAKQLKADVLSFSERATMQSFVANGILTPWIVPRFKEIPDKFKNPKGYYYAQAVIVVGISFNKAFVKAGDLPRTWKALLDPKWQGKVGMTTAYTGGLGWTTAMFTRQKFGLDYWKKLAAQKPFLASGVGQVTDALVRGQIHIAINHLGTVRRQSVAGAPLGFYFPREGSPSVIESVGMTSTASHSRAARLFLNWVMSRYGQRVFAKLSSEYTVYPDIVGPGMPKSARAALWYPKLKDYIKLRKQWLDEWGRTFNYTP